MKLFILTFCLLLTGCSTTTLITFEDDKQITIKSGRYELVEVKRGDTSFKIDKRGRPGLIEQIAALWGASGIRKESE
jgi:hypothetical protein